MQMLKEAIKRRRASKIDPTDFQKEDGLVEKNKELEEIGLAPEIEDRGGSDDMPESGEQVMSNEDQESTMVYNEEQEKGAVEEPNEIEEVGQRVQLQEKMPKKKEDELENLNGMYADGDETKKGFMGKAAAKMRERLNQIKKQKSQSSMDEDQGLTTRK